MNWKRTLTCMTENNKLKVLLFTCLLLKCVKAVWLLLQLIWCKNVLFFLFFLLVCLFVCWWTEVLWLCLFHSHSFVIFKCHYRCCGHSVALFFFLSVFSRRLFSICTETFLVLVIVGYFCSINRVTHIPFFPHSDAKLNFTRLLKCTELLPCDRLITLCFTKQFNIWSNKAVSECSFHFMYRYWNTPVPPFKIK